MKSLKKSVLKVNGLTHLEKERLKELTKTELGLSTMSDGATQLIRNFINKDNPLMVKDIDIKKGYIRTELRININHYKALETLAKNTDTSTLNYIRSLIAVHLLSEPALLGTELTALRDSNYQIKKIGINLNQIAKALNAGQSGAFDMDQLHLIIEWITNHAELIEGLIKANIKRMANK